MRKGGMLLLRIKFGVISLILIACGLNAQTLFNDVLDNYAFVNQKADTVSNAKVLSAFFEKLAQRQVEGDSSKISIVHIGDSHIQGDFLTREMRLNFQRDFGNAGRALIFPYRLAKTYEPKDISTNSVNNWISAKVFGSRRLFEPGISGYSIQSSDSNVVLQVATLNHDSLDYSFSKISIIGSINKASYELSAMDTLGRKYRFVNGENEQLKTLNLNNALNSIQLQANDTSVLKQNQMRIDGIVLENQKPGILYHVVGVNSAHFVDYNRSPLFFEQLPLLKPDIILISLGTNEGVNPSVSKAEIYEAVANMCESIRNQNPQVPIVLITAFDDYYRNKYYNKYLGIVRQASVDYAKKYNMAYVDAYAITGGYGSAAAWRKAGLLRADGIHYSQDGYMLQGKIIYQAFMNSFLKYAKH